MINAKLAKYIDSLRMEGVSSQRRQVLQPLISFIQEKRAENTLNPVQLNFICTHNSRRSHLAQVWAQTMAAYYGVDNIRCYSGGTEATAVFSQVLKTLESAGFEVEINTESDNPKQLISYSTEHPPIEAYSKRWDDSANPQKDFVAVMTCSHADKNCPLIIGAEARIPVTYDDPKDFDNTPVMIEKYEESSRQIAMEMRYVFERVN